MSLTGSFTTMPFPDLLQWLGESRRSGTLTVSLEFEERRFRVDAGALVALGSDDPRSGDLARLTLTRGLIDEPMLRRALAVQARSRGPLLTVLVDGGFVPRAALVAALRAHAKDSALQLFLWSDGRFLFYDETDGALGDDGRADELPLDPPLPLRELLLDGMRRLDEWRRIAEVLPSDYAVVHAIGRPGDLPALDALYDLGIPTSLGDLCLQLGRPRLPILEELYEGWRRGLLAVDAVPQQMKTEPHQSPVDVLVASAAALAEENQFDEAAALLRSALELDPYHQRARALLGRARAAQLEELYREFPPHRVPFPTAGRDAALRTLAPRERYLYARIDGARDVGALTVMTPLGELETLRALKRFHHVGLVVLM